MSTAQNALEWLKLEYLDPSFALVTDEEATDDNYQEKLAQIEVFLKKAFRDSFEFSYILEILRLERMQRDG